MSQTFENFVRSYFIRCGDIGLDCNYVIYGINEEKAIDNTIVHMYEYHAINPEEVTACMRLKIEKNINHRHSLPRQAQLAYKRSHATLVPQSMKPSEKQSLEAIEAESRLPEQKEESVLTELDSEIDVMM